MRLETNCYKCANMREVPGNAHVQCAKPDPDMEGHPHGIRKGWFFYPLLFDPVWRTRECVNFQERGMSDLPLSMSMFATRAGYWKAEAERLTQERDSFYADYRIKCDEETKRQAVEIERLRSEAEGARLRVEEIYGRYDRLTLDLKRIVEERDWISEAALEQIMRRADELMEGKK